jgi:hypothetical protein
MSWSRFARQGSQMGKVRYELAILACLLCCLPLFGQGSLSTLRGTVTDPSGAVVPHAKVTIEEVGTGITARTLTTDAQGNYEVPALKEATYRLRVEARGFETYVVSDIHLAGSEAKRVDATLRVGATASEVTVSGAAAVIETEGARIGSEFSGDQYQIAPLPANSYSSPLPVIATMPQIQTDAGNEFGVTMAGQGGAEIHMAMDGVKEENLNTQTVNMEDVEEVKVNAVNNSAEYARVGYFDTITKHGANQYHAEASYYDRNSALGARGFFEPQKPIVIYNTINLSGSGPIRRNRTFFYGLWNGERVHEQSFFNVNVPTDKMRGGDFSELLAGPNPIQLYDPYTGLPFQGNMIPQGKLNTLALKVQDLYIPHPNQNLNLAPPDNLVNNFGWLFPYPGDQYRADVLVARVDHKISDKNFIYGRYSGYWPRYVLNDGNFPNLDWTKLRQSHSWAFVDTHTFTPNLVNSFTFGGNRDRSVYGVKLNGYQPPTGDQVVSAIGLQGVNPGNLAAQGVPDMYFNDIAGPGIEVPPGGVNGKAAELSENWSFADAVTWAKGRHVMKFGEELRTLMYYTTDLPNGTYGDFYFDGSMTGTQTSGGYDYADFLLGLPINSSRLNPLIGRTQHGKELGLFAMDTFKVTRKLTFDYGLRWDYFGAFRYDDGLQDRYDPTQDAVVVPQSALSKVSPLYPNTIKVVTGQVVPNPSLHNFVPRLGAAYLITEKTVVRGGYGLFTSRGLGVYSLLDSGPFSIAENYVNTPSSPLFAFPDPYPGDLGLAHVPTQGVIGYPLDMRDGKIHQFNATVEHQFKDTGVRMSYVGSRTRGLNGFYEVNKKQPNTTDYSDSLLPHPEFRSIQLLRRDLAANYDSLTLEGRRKVGQVSFDAFWTWANNLDNYEMLASGYGTLYGPSAGAFGDENPYAPLLWNHDHVTPHHRVVVNAQWEIPLGRGRRYLSQAPGVVDKVLGGWTAYYVGFFQTGQWFTPFFSGADPSNTNSFGGLPDRIANGNLPPSQRTVKQWFDTSAFKVPPNVGRFGNSGINILEGPGLMSHNLTLRKRFQITERLHFDFMALCSNLFNHPNFSPPSSTIGDPDAGMITGQHDRYFSGEKSGPRVIELRGRIEF